MLTKRMAEDLTEYLNEHGVRVRYLHADIETVERTEIIRDLRLGKFDVLVGINLLREGLDMPEVALVAILDADKEGFLRSDNSLIQTIGRAARNINGRAILYADRITGSMERAIEETDRRRKTSRWSTTRPHGITPRGINKGGHRTSWKVRARRLPRCPPGAAASRAPQGRSRRGLEPRGAGEGDQAPGGGDVQKARNLEFEQAAGLRDEIERLKQLELGFPPPLTQT